MLDEFTQGMSRQDKIIFYCVCALIVLLGFALGVFGSAILAYYKLA